jgi:hypothetical protein
MEPGSVEAALELQPPVPSEVHWLEDGLIMTITPLEPLQSETTYVAYLAPGAMSIAGMIMEEGYEFGFSTGAASDPPMVTAIYPVDGQIDVLAGEPIEIVFDQTMSTSSVEDAMAVSPSMDHALYWREDNTVAVLQPLSPMEANVTYAITVGADALSAAGIPLGGDFSSRFTTSIMSFPHVLGTLPADGSTAVPSNHPIQVVFDWPMNPASVEEALTVSPGMEYTTTWLEAGFVLVIEPTVSLEEDTTYIFEIDAQAMSADGLPLQGGHTFGFGTAGAE